MSDFLRGSAKDDAIVDLESDERISYGALSARVERLAERLDGSRRRLVLLMAQAEPHRMVRTIVAYLACLRARLPVLLIDADREAALEPLLQTYRPETVLLTNPGYPAGYESSFTERDLPGEVWIADCKRPEPIPLHPDLALLLQTSASTGSPRLVRLSHGNLRANAEAIAHYLDLGPGERALQSLPLAYAYGLSILNSHLCSGGAVLLPRASFMRPGFWDDARVEGATSFAGVPFMYETLHRLQFDVGQHPSLRTMTQAGGALRPDLVRQFAHLLGQETRRFYVMYGQTEATARIAYVPPERLLDKPMSVGIAIPGGRLWCDGDELMYAGPNVMMGYATGPADLSLGDTLGGQLRTGDLGKVDDEGFAYVVGRLARFAKLFGKRFQLDDVERFVEERWRVAAIVVEHDAGLGVFVENGEQVDPDDVMRTVSRLIGLPGSTVRVSPVDSLPRTAAGKKDYRATRA